MLLSACFRYLATSDEDDVDGGTTASGVVGVVTAEAEAEADVEGPAPAVSAKASIGGGWWCSIVAGEVTTRTGF